MRIGTRAVGSGKPVYTIFEVASTHGGDWEQAAAYVDMAAEAGADAVKFQLFEADKLLLPLTEGLKNTYDYLKSAETPREWYPQLKARCGERGIDLLCTPFDTDAAEFLRPLVSAMKIASGDLTFLPLLERVASFGMPVMLSTGMATMDEIETAVDTLRKHGAADVALLQCVSVYPTSYEDANVSAMETLGSTFNTVVGYSDNGSEGMLVPLLAVACGASIIEKHVTAKKERGDLDDAFSMSVDEFGQMVRHVRESEGMQREAAVALLRAEYGAKVDVALGDGIKRPAPHGTLVERPGMAPFVMREADERRWARRGVYPARDIKKGETVTPEMLTLLRPDIGISARSWTDVIGKVADENVPARRPLALHNSRVVMYGDIV